MYTFFGQGKTPRLSKKNIEAEIEEGGLKLHNTRDFSKIFKSTWVKCLMKSDAKWTNLPRLWGLDKIILLWACLHRQNV